MAGFDYAAGRSNNMVEAEARGMVTIGRWAKRHGISARAAKAIMRPSEAHHTGTGFRGRSRLTPVIDADTEPSADELAEMRAYDPEQIERDRRAAEAAKPLILNSYGNVDVRGGCENGVIVINLPAPAAALRAAGIVFGEALTGFTKSRGRYTPDFSGWVLEKDWEIKLAACPPYVASAPTPLPGPQPVDGSITSPSPRQAHPLTMEEKGVLVAADLEPLRSLARRERKSFLYAARLPNRAAALDWVAGHLCELVTG